METVVGQQRREEQEQVDDRKCEETVGGLALLPLAAAVQPPCEPDEEDATGEGACTVGGAGKPKRPGQPRHWDQKDATDEDLPRRRQPSAKDPQPGDAGPGGFRA